MLRIGTLIALLLLASYGVVKGLPLLAGPAIALTSPTEGQSFPDGFVKVEGTAHRTESLAMNGSPLPIDAKGHFSATLVLPHGSAILSWTARDRFGKTASVRRTIFIP
jgi:hypothetical protein